MSSRTKRTAAVNPAAGYRSPRSVTPCGLVATVTTEDGKTRVFDFSDLDVPPDLLRALVAAFAKASGRAGSWRRMASVESGTTALRRLARYLAAEHPDVTTITALMPDVWAAWRAHVESTSRYATAVWASCTLLRHAEGLPRTTWLALNDRFPEPGPDEREMVSYSRNEFARIWRAARRVFAAALARIRANLEILDRYRAGDEPEDCWRVRFRGEELSLGDILASLSVTGNLPHSSRGVHRERTRALRQALGIGEACGYCRVALFPDVIEIYAVMIMLVCERALNLSVMDNLKVGDATRVPGPRAAHWIYQLDLEKPRRGADSYSPITLTGRGARAWERTVALTQPARDTLATLGQPTDQLLVACARGARTAHPTRIFMTDWSDVHGAACAWRDAVTVAGDDGKPLDVSLERLRLSEIVINGEPQQHSPDVSERRYRGPDPQTGRQARPVLFRGQYDAVDDADRQAVWLLSEGDMEAARADPAGFAARRGVEVKRANEVLSGRRDTPTAGCIDIMQSPHPQDGGGACTASFLACLVCPNAVIMPHHIPRLVTAHEALVTAARASTHAVKEKHYRGHIAAVEAVLARVPRVEVERARAAVTPGDIETVMRLLNGDFDA